jgi:hypothetical protein
VNFKKMIELQTSELNNTQLDWAVDKALGYAGTAQEWLEDYNNHEGARYSTDWAKGGPIIEDEGLDLNQYADYPRWKSGSCYGSTPLIAAMLGYVSSKLGLVIEIPVEIAPQQSTKKYRNPFP